MAKTPDYPHWHDTAWLWNDDHCLVRWRSSRLYGYTWVVSATELHGPEIERLLAIVTTEVPMRVFSLVIGRTSQLNFQWDYDVEVLQRYQIPSQIPETHIPDVPVAIIDQSLIQICERLKTIVLEYKLEGRHIAL